MRDVDRIEVAAPLGAAVAGQHLPRRRGAGAPRRLGVLRPAEVPLVVADHPVLVAVDEPAVDRRHRVLHGLGGVEAVEHRRQLRRRLVRGVLDRQLARPERLQRVVGVHARDDRPVLRHVVQRHRHGVHDLPEAPDVDRLGPRHERHLAAVEGHARALAVVAGHHRLGVHVGDVDVVDRRAPRHVLVHAEDDPGQPRKLHAHHVELAARHQVREVEDRRVLQRQVRVVGHHHVPRRRQLRPHDPVVAAQARVGLVVVPHAAHRARRLGEHGQQRAILGRVIRRARAVAAGHARPARRQRVGLVERRQDLEVVADALARRQRRHRRVVELRLGRRRELRAEDVAVGVVRELERQDLPDEQRVDLGPRLDRRRVVQEHQRRRQRELLRLQVGDVRVHARGVARQHPRRRHVLRIRRRRQGRPRRLAGLLEVVHAHLDVAVDERRRHVAEQLRERSCRRVARQVHLDQAVLRRHVALREGHVRLVVAVDVRDAPLVAHHVDAALERRVVHDVGLGNVVYRVAAAAD